MMTRNVFAAISLLTLIGCNEADAFAGKDVRKIEVRTTQELFAARDTLRKERPSAPVDVRLAPGEYFLEKPFVLTAEDSGRESAPIRWGCADGKAVFIAAKRVPADRFRPWKDGIVVADISDLGVACPDEHRIRGVKNSPPPVPEVFVDGRRLVMASWPNAGEWATFTNFVKKGAGWDVKSPTNKHGKAWSNGVFGYDGDRPSRWTKAPYVWIHGYFKWDWRDNLLPVGRIDVEKRQIELGARATYGLGRGNPSPRRWRVVHLLEELDAPGEYYVDFFAKKLYLMPEGRISPKTRVEIVAGAGTLVVAKDLAWTVFKNIDFVCANAALKGEKCSHVEIVNSTVENIRGNGMEIDASDHVLVKTCDFRGIGACCLNLNGGDRRTLVSAENRVTDCDFGPAGVYMKAGAAGFSTYGVGTVFDHNVVHDMPHHAVGVSWQGGNDCRFECNVISNCCNESDDAAAFYKGRNPSSCGNVLRGNVFVDCGKNGKHGTMAVYFDDGDCGETVEDNLFIRCGNPPYGDAKFTHGALFYNAGYAFTTRGNVFLDCPAGCRTSGADGWATDAWWRKHLNGLRKRLLEEVCVTGAVYTAHYPWIRDLLPGLPDGQRTNYLERCTFINVKVPASGRSFCAPDCRILERDDGTRPEATRSAGLVTPRR